jgi:hypothetical protein
MSSPLEVSINPSPVAQKMFTAFMPSQSDRNELLCKILRSFPGLAIGKIFYL